jgi:hypothetical protein
MVGLLPLTRAPEKVTSYMFKQHFLNNWDQLIQEDHKSEMMEHKTYHIKLQNIKMNSLLTENYIPSRNTLKKGR